MPIPRWQLFGNCCTRAATNTPVPLSIFSSIIFWRSISCPLTGETLSGFVPDFYHVLTVHAARLPPAAGRMAEYMIRQDWLTNYQFAEGIDRSLKGVSRRTAYPSGLDTAIIDFTAYHGQIARHFSLFWPALVDHCQQVRTLLLDRL